MPDVNAPDASGGLPTGDAASSDLFQPVQAGPATLANRIVMAPLTRSRAGVGDVPRALNAEYCAQRATAGLIISEASQISRQGKGYAYTPASTPRPRWQAGGS